MFSTFAGPADFPGALVQLTRPKQVIVEHVDYPNQASLHRRMLPKIVSVLNSFITFTRFSIAAQVNEAGLIEIVPLDQARMDYNPITLAKKGLLIEEARTNLISRSSDPTCLWSKARSTITVSTNFPIFANDGGFLLTCDGTSGGKGVTRYFVSSSTSRTCSVYLRRGTNSFLRF